MSIEAMELALEALKFVNQTGDTQTFDMCYADKAITAIENALAQPKKPEQEPVGKFAKFTDNIWREVTAGSAGVPLYTTPPQPKEPEQEQGEPVAVVTGVYGGRFIVEPANSAMVLPVNMALYAHPQPRKPLTGEVVVIAAQSCLSPQQYDHFEALLENDQDAHNRLARAIEAAHNIKE